ncbi:LemA family protein [Undibacterium sp. Jales W-56]|uniref:LemA family protein n=1 Tax=Undibacterium sp. Jales W-56 TaxID=2897325 RepID=UPI0021CE084F|nr:LemA family protein [Undibacterium sp. Jales W-56]MCU6434952.1 LemA family protein [Undibacterium sp. Jales W-56]
MSALIVLLVIIAVVAFWAVGAYNRLVSLRNRFKNSFAQIDVQLKRRYDLIPNLVETAKGYMKHERETLEAVIAARNQAVTANTKAGSDPSDAAAVQQLAAAEGTLTASLGKMFALSEAYPDLKANENMMQLTEELTGTENKIAFSRQAYNDSVMQYNTSIEQFPGSVIANMCGFKPGELLQATESPEERKAVKVSF